MGLADSLRHLIEQVSRSAPKFAPNCKLHCFNSTGNLLNSFIIKGFVVGRARFERATIALKVPNLLL
jgi:hypothetical protein